MFTKIKSKKNENTNLNNEHKNQSTLKSWLTGKLGSFLLLSAVGYALYKLGIINRITNFFKKDKGQERAPNADQPESSARTI